MDKDKLKYLVKIYIIVNIALFLSMFLCKPLYVGNEAFYWFLVKLIFIICNVSVILAHILKWLIYGKIKY